MDNLAKNITVIILSAFFTLLTVPTSLYSADCPERTTVNVSSKSSAYPENNSIDWSNVRKVLALKDSSIGVTSYAPYILIYGYNLFID